jgi:protein-disulfide isomerase
VYSKQSAFVMRSLLEKYGTRIRYAYRDFPVHELHPEAQKAAEAGKCAQEQGKFWEYHDKLYLNQSDLRESRLVDLAKETNLDMNAFRTCLKSGAMADAVIKDTRAGAEAGVRGTPTFFINGVRVEGAIPEDVFSRLIEQMIEAEL